MFNSGTKLICGTCRKEGKKSRVFATGGSRTLMNYQLFYDEEGVYHSHDPNVTTHSFQCSNGHGWSIVTEDKCPNCEFGKGESIH